MGSTACLTSLAVMCCRDLVVSFFAVYSLAAGSRHDYVLCPIAVSDISIRELWECLVLEVFLSPTAKSLRHESNATLELQPRSTSTHIPGQGRGTLDASRRPRAN